MLRIFLSMAIYVVAARWIYAELKIVAPGLAPVVETALQTIQIPTHDQWDKIAIRSYVSTALAETQELIAIKDNAQPPAPSFVR